MNCRYWYHVNGPVTVIRWSHVALLEQVMMNSVGAMLDHYTVRFDVGPVKVFRWPHGGGLSEAVVMNRWRNASPL